MDVNDDYIVQYKCHFTNIHIQIDLWHTDKHGVIQIQPSSNYVPLIVPEHFSVSI